jgi:hypothetical protein
MENTGFTEQEDKSLVINAEIESYLQETAKWGKFLAIVGYVSIGLFVILALVMMLGVSQLNNVPNVGFPVGLIGFIYILIAVLYYFPVNYLYRFSARIKEGINLKNQISINSGFQNLKSLFKFMAICTIVVLSIYGLILLIAIPSILLLK